MAKAWAAILGFVDGSRGLAASWTQVDAHLLPRTVRAVPGSCTNRAEDRGEAPMVFLKLHRKAMPVLATID